MIPFPSPSFWQNRSVFLTGHTGFIGGWMTLWLSQLGARVTGYALEPPSEPNFFNAASIVQHCAESHIADLCDAQALAEALRRANPSVVLHLAAQPIVREAHRDPAETYRVNVMGTLQLLQALRKISSLESVLVFTTDKIYENGETGERFRENAPIGGKGIYDSSKACAELLTRAFHQSFFPKLGMATLRAGNVIGGGDWGQDRLVPDAMRAFSRSETLVIRAPFAVRPWQHVLEPVGAALLLAERLASRPQDSGGWNIGPDVSSEVTVGELVPQLAELWGRDAKWRVDASSAVPESKTLRLDSTKARTQLGWHPRWGLRETLERTVAWYQAFYAGEEMLKLSLSQMEAFQRRALHEAA